MKVTGIISALVFAHVAMGQASDSTSTSVSGTKSSSSTKTGTKSASSSSTATNATPTGSTGSSSSGGSLTKSSTGLLVPEGISPACSAFLTSLNSDTTMAGCLGPISNALSSFASGPGSASAASKALTALCSSNSCKASDMRAKLNEFKDACENDFTNDMVAQQYDVWYSITPFKAAICSQDTDNMYCFTKIASSSSTTSKARRSHAADPLVIPINKRAQTVITADLDTMRTSNIPYLGLSPDMNNGELCTSCAQQILSKYVAWESATPHALGVSKSPFLGGQSALWAAMQNKCADGFTTQITNIAGVASADQLADGAVTTTASYFTALAAAFAAALALF